MRVVEGSVKQHAVGRTAVDGVDGQRHRSRQLPESLEPRRIAGVHPEAGGQPVRGDQAHAVDGCMRPRCGKEAARREPVHV